jgi:hypothetical protein
MAVVSSFQIEQGNVLAGAWVSQAERVAKIATDRLYLIRVMPAQG